MGLRKFYILLFFMIILTYSEVYSYEICDSLRECTGRALTLSVPFGKGAHYVDVDKTQAQDNITDQMTVDFWMKPIRQPNKIQFIAGLWGPGRDRNDVWVIYINEKDELVFELNGNGTNLGEIDNTIAKISADNLYDTWHHIAAVFDGITRQAYIYIDNVIASVASNPDYPLNKLRLLQNKNLPIQIGSCNALSDNKNLYRTFLGQIDEFRLWSRVLTPDEIYCYRLKSLIGSEPGLVLYHRYNEHENQYNLCDASGNGAIGRARSGAACTKSDRKNIPTFFILESNYNIVDTLKCDTTWSITFTVVDTSRCGNKVYFIFRDSLQQSYSLNPPYTAQNPMILQQNIPQQVTVTLNSKFLGNIYTRFYAVRTNSCDNYIRKNFILTRITELNYSTSSIDFDTIKANCQTSIPKDTTLTICNNSKGIGTPRSLTINDIRSNLGGIYQVIAPNFPITLLLDECVDIKVRFRSDVPSGTYYDTLKIYSNDKCVSYGVITLKGTALDVISITKNDGKTEIDTINFGTQCLNWPSDPVEYIWKNLINEDIYIDSIIVPNHFIGKAFKFPVLLEPQTGYLPNYFRFLPTAAGNFLDSIIFVVRAGECITYKKIYVKGKGFFADVKFTVSSLDFGNVKVGQENTLNVTIENLCEETLNVSFYLKDGSSFFFTGNKFITIPSGQQRSIPLTFIPTDEKNFEDELCLFEQRCFTSSCIKIKGYGYFERFDFEPLIMKTENVIGCKARMDTLSIRNISTSTVTVSNFVLDNLPTQKYSVVYPANLSNFSRILNPNDTIQFIFNFSPNDVLNELAERAYLRFKTSDGLDWSAKLLGSSIIPKIFITDETIYGRVEVGDRKRDTLEIYNYSSVPIKIDSIIAEGPFELIYPDPYSSFILDSRDSVMAIVDFVPDREADFVDVITVYSSEPCIIDNAGWLIGSGIVIPLDIPMSIISNGFVRPCDCVTRKINLINQSHVFPRTIDSVWIDTTGFVNSDPNFFTWTAWGSPMGTTPFDVLPLSFDTIYVTFCPRSPAERRLIDIGANLMIKASGKGWEGNVFTINMSGKRQLIMEPIPNFAYFPPTRVDTFSNVSQFVDIIIPEFEVNPVRGNIKIDSITFIPNERVFFVSDTLNNLPPFIVDTNGYMRLKLDFKPRAVRPYEAKMNIFMSEPCYTVDTTVWVYGESFAPSFGLDFNFENNRIYPDTFRVNYCDTLKVDIFSSRNFPADVVDIKIGLLYDTNKLEFLYGDSPYLYDTCYSYQPYITDDLINVNGKSLLLKNFCFVDSTKPFLSAYFLPTSSNRDTFSIKIDSIYFDTEEVILYQIIAQIDSAVVIVIKPDFEVLNNIDFDSVQVLDCAYDTLLIKNIGDVPIKLEPISNLPSNLRIIGSNPNINSYYNVGDTAKIYLEYCPRRKALIDTIQSVENLEPCLLIDNYNLRAEAWAPDFPVKINTNFDFSTMDTLRATIGDTLQVPIIFEKNFSVVLRGEEFWIEDLDFDVEIAYNPRALEYISTDLVNKSISFNVNYTPGYLNYNFKSVDSLRKTEIAFIKFLVVVPDSVQTKIDMNTKNYFTDSFMFINIIPEPNTVLFISNEKCNISTLLFDESQPYLYTNYPNPWNDRTKIDFYIPDETKVTIELYSIDGGFITQLIENKSFKKGLYSLEINSDLLDKGIYFYRMISSNQIMVRKMILIK